MNIMKKFSAYIIIIVLTLIGCKRDMIYTKLEGIDSLLLNDKLDSAYLEISKIQLSNIEERDIAYFYLLKTQTLYRLYKPVTSDSIINYSIKYYEKSKDKEKLACAYYYKGVTIYDLGRTKDALLNIKKAENIALKNKDTILIHKIYEILSIFNAYSGEYDLAMKYAKLTLKLSYKEHNKNWIVYALNNMAGLYEKMKMDDLAVYYANKCMPLMKYVYKENKIDILSTIGTSYISKNRELAIKYLQKAISIHPDAETYLSLATIYSKEGNTDKANEYWHKALNTKDLKLRSDALQAIFDSKYKGQNYREACDISRQLLSTNEALADRQNQEQVKMTQYGYDEEMETARVRQNATYATTITMILTMILLAMWIYYKYKSTKLRNEIMQNQMLINFYTTDIEKIKASNDDETKEIEKLKHKLSDLQKRQSQILSKGHKLYDSIIAGKTTSNWCKDDFINFIEYYRILDLPFIAYIEERYDCLSPKYKFFEILYHIDKTDEEVCQIMEISSSTMRANKTRIKRKMVVP